MSAKHYLGDGVYATNDGYMIALTADAGSDIERTIWLDPSVFTALVNYARTEGL